MKKLLLTVLQFLTVIFGFSMAGLMLWFPNIEGVNANATSFYDVYLDDPFLAFAYFASIPFFIALYQIFNILQSKCILRSLQIIKYCATFYIVFGIGLIIFIALSNEDDKPGGYMLGAITILGSIISKIIAEKAVLKLK